MSYCIAGLCVKSGSKTHEFLTVAETATVEMKIPLMVVNGASPGPTLCLVAGTHATEYAGVVAATRIYWNTDPKKLNGRLVIIPILNMPSFQDKVPYVCKLDNKNLSSVFPGKEEGTISERITFKTYKEIFQKVDYIIDLHGGEVGEEMMRLAIFEVTGNKDIDVKSQNIANAFQTEYSIMSTRLEERKSEYGSLTGIASLNGIPSIVSEAGDSGKLLEEDIQFHVKGVQNVMKKLKMTEGHPETFGERKMLKRSYIRAKHGGIFQSLVRPGDTVQKDQILGKIMNIFGVIMEEIRSPNDGVIYFSLYGPIKNPGDMLFGLGLFT